MGKVYASDLYPKTKNPDRKVYVEDLYPISKPIKKSVYMEGEDPLVTGPVVVIPQINSGITKSTKIKLEDFLVE